MKTPAPHQDRPEDVDLRECQPLSDCHPEE